MIKEIECKGQLGFINEWEVGTIFTDGDIYYMKIQPAPAKIADMTITQ